MTEGHSTSEISFLEFDAALPNPIGKPRPFAATAPRGNATEDGAVWFRYPFVVHCEHGGLATHTIFHRWADRVGVHPALNGFVDRITIDGVARMADAVRPGTSKDKLSMN